MQLAADLRDGGWAAKTVELALVPDSGELWSACHALVETTADPAVLTQALLRMSWRAPRLAGVESVTVRAVEVSTAVARQHELFPPDQGQANQLRAVLGRLGARHASSIMRPVLADPQARLPERRVHFEPLEPP